jgi:hypothetical protein
MAYCENGTFITELYEEEYSIQHHTNDAEAEMLILKLPEEFSIEDFIRIALNTPGVVYINGRKIRKKV